VIEPAVTYLGGSLGDAAFASVVIGVQELASRVPAILPPAAVRPPAPVLISLQGSLESPLIVRAADSLSAKRIVTAKEFYQWQDATRRKAAFTISGMTKASIAKVQQAALSMVEKRDLSLREFERRIGNEFLKSGLGPARLELVYRNAIQSAFADGLDVSHQIPVVEAAFPYVEYVSIHDAQTRPMHRALESLGIQGTAIYRSDDPVIKLFRPPISWNCRCGRVFLTVQQAAARGIEEAKYCLKHQISPYSLPNPAYVKMPPFRPDPGFGGTIRPAQRRRGRVRMSADIVWDGPDYQGLRRETEHQHLFI